ncbi:YqaJ viral recombinase family nuclease [Corynebacterium striatum]|uniref:YqaJ viral recombinase family nuclease n=1 Tax=Corynebacterium striatum TaxID=43770 RepID=UPI0027BA6183|nr:YqaJ viral recombinase family protein [Corynebacterium striatum]
MNNTTYVPLPATNNRAEWLAQRNEGIGSSDASAIAGLSTFESPYSLWEIKTGRAPIDPPVDKTTERLREWGNRLEPVILDATAEELGVGIVKPEVGYKSTKHNWMRCNLDGWTEDGRIFEAKTVHLAQRHKWDGQIADHAEIQVTHSAMVTGADRAVVAALIAGSDLRVYEYEINPRIQEILFEMEQKFWHCVETDTPPDVDGHARTIEVLTSEWAHNPQPREVSEDEVQDIWAAWMDADTRKKQAEHDLNKAKAQLAQLMDGHDSLTSGDRVWARTRRGRLNLKRLQADQPELVTQYTRPRPMFDMDRFKAEKPGVYTEYQYTSINPVKEN